MGQVLVAGGAGIGVSSDDCTAPKKYVLEGYKTITSDSDDEIVEGTMKINGAQSGTLKCGESKTIPEGYTVGGTVTAASLKSQTDGTAAANQISSGKTAWVKGVEVTGNLVERGQAQYGTPVLTASYLAINALPEGIYRKNGASWAPEARCDLAALRTALGINAARILSGTTMCGVAGTLTCNSIINFSAEIYSGRQVLLKWQNPKVSSGKPFEGVFITYGTSANPGTNGTKIYTGTGDNITAEAWSKVIITMPSYSTTYYFSATPYVNFYVNGTALTASYGKTLNSGAVKTSSAPCRDCSDCSDCGDGCSWDCSDCHSPTVCAGGV